MGPTVLTDPPRDASAQPLDACPNCEAPRMGEYCHTCGQHFLDGRLTVRRLVRDFVVRMLGLEGGLLRTVVDLTIRPASMIRQYIDGRRQRYTNPVAYLLLSAGANVLFAETWADDVAAGMRSDNARFENVDAESMVQVQIYMDSHPALSTVILCLFLVPALRLMFRRTTTLVEASVFSLYVSGHLLLMQIVINIGALVLGADVYRVMTGRITLIPTLLLLFSAGRFFGKRFSSSLKMAVAVAISLVGFVVLLLMVVAVVSELAFTGPVPPSP